METPNHPVTTVSGKDVIDVNPSQLDSGIVRLQNLMRSAESTKTEYQRELEKRGRSYVYRVIERVGRENPEALHQCRTWAGSLTNDTLRK